MASNKKVRHRKPAIYQRTEGFWCCWCGKNLPRNERFVPYYYRAELGHRRGVAMCFGCHLDGDGLNGSTPRRLRGKARPNLTAETLAAFWMEDVSDGSYVQAAVKFFRVRTTVIELVMQEIKT